MGRHKEVSDTTILKEVALAPGPVVTAPELADRVGMTSGGVNKRLDALVESGHLHEREVGARAIVYWLTEKGKKKAAQC